MSHFAINNVPNVFSTGFLRSLAVVTWKAVWHGSPFHFDSFGPGPRELFLMPECCCCRVLNLLNLCVFAKR